MQDIVTASSENIVATQYEAIQHTQ